MKRFLAHVDRWGPLCFSLLTALAVAGFLWISDSRQARAEGRVDEIQVQIDRRVAHLEHEIESHTQIEGDLRLEIQTWQAHVVALRGAMIAAGIRDIPPAPAPPPRRH
jgi:hypothetical protein